MGKNRVVTIACVLAKLTGKLIGSFGNVFFSIGNKTKGYDKLLCGDFQLKQVSIEKVGSESVNVPSPSPSPSPSPVLEHKSTSIKSGWKARARDKAKNRDKAKLKLIKNEVSSVKEENNTFCEQDLPKKRMPAA
ncbi:MAG: hypothetical protein HQK49_04730 [Oligoflexia bacterium]|nr:hypothetical protein [Oligoflexia bacterium]